MEVSEIVLKKCVLRKFTEQDYLGYYRIVSDSETMKYINWGPVRNLDEIKKIVDSICDYYETRQHLEWIVELKETNEIVGSIIVYQIEKDQSCEIAYIIGRFFWNQGYATEIVTGLIKYLFSFGLTKIKAKHSPGNISSGHVLVKSGFSLVKTINRYNNNGYKDTHHLYYEIKNG